MERAPCTVQHARDGAGVGGPRASLCSWKSPCPMCPWSGGTDWGAAGGREGGDGGRCVCRMTRVVASSSAIAGFPLHSLNLICKLETRKMRRKEDQ